MNIIEKIATKMGGNLGSTNLKGGFIWDVFIIFIFIFTLFLALPPIMNLGQIVATHTIANNPGLNATQISIINHDSTNFFLNTPSIMLALLYFTLLIAAMISATYQGANPAVTLFLGIFFIAIAMVVSFPLSDIAHSFITQAIFVNDAAHLSIMIYIMNYAPYFNAVMIIVYMVLVIMRREVISNALSGGSGGGGGNQFISS